MATESAPRITLKLARVTPHRFPDLELVPLPTYKSTYASGMDLCADVDSDGIAILPHRVGIIPTGILMELPEGYEGQIRPRSGLAIKNYITVINSPGTIDSDFRGEVMVGLVNHSDAIFHVHRGDRIAQLVICAVACPLVTVVEQSELTDTQRGSGALGSTGINDTNLKR